MKQHMRKNTMFAMGPRQVFCAQVYLTLTEELHAFNTNFSDADFVVFGNQIVDVSSVACWVANALRAFPTRGHGVS